jgi:tetratricopeptide (TPR) repeat protein
LAAGIEGNLGYLASRRGDFGQALRLYDNARVGFEQLGEVGLLLAVLEVDHARTLLDIGLGLDALEAAEQAVRSAAEGDNQMLETQARLLVAEALIDVGEHRLAAEALERGRHLADRLGQAPWALRASYLASRLDVDQTGTSDDDIGQLLEAGWTKEAYEAAIHRAMLLRGQDPQRCRRLMNDVRQQTLDHEIDPVHRRLGELIAAEAVGDHEAGRRAFAAALDSVVEQQALLGSAELAAVIVQRLRPIAQVGVSLALRAADPGPAVFTVLEQIRTRYQMGPTSRHHSPSSDHGSDISLLRDARVALEQAKLDGHQTDAIAAAASTVRELERGVLRRRRSRPGSAQPAPVIAATDGADLPTDTAYVGFAVHEHRMLASVATTESITVHDLGTAAALRAPIRTQQGALRHLADERRVHTDRSVERLDRACDDLGAALVKPLPIDDVDRVLITPSGLVGDVAWNALPQLRARPVTIAPSLTDWTAENSRLAVSDVGFVGGGGLEHIDSELGAIAELWGRPDAALPRASCREAQAVLDQADLVHVSTHGSFRRDNPFFSSIELEDGPLSVLAMTELTNLPSIIVLAACDAAQTGGGEAGADAVMGTAHELRRQGVRVVIAPMTVLNDAAGAEFSIELHRNLTNGKSMDDAMVAARSMLRQTGDPRAVAAAAALQLFGGRSTRKPIVGGY